MTYLLGALVIVGLILVSVGLHKDETASFDDGSFPIMVGAIALGIVSLLVAVFLGIVLLLPFPARAHDHARPDLNGWFKSLQSRGKSPCCDGSDATSLEDPDWETKDSHYRVRLEGQWVDVPDTAVVDGPNKDGRAMVWPMYMNGYPAVRCFLPGSMT